MQLDYSLSGFLYQRCQSDLNQRSGSCSPMPYHLAMAPYIFASLILYSIIQFYATGDVMSFDNKDERRLGSAKL